MKTALRFLFLIPAITFAQTGARTGATTPALGVAPASEAIPRLEFVFEERVTIGPAVPLGETALGYRQYIGITGGEIAGPKLTGRVVPGGFDFQLTYKATNCTRLSADYFIQAEDGTNIHVFNEGVACPDGGRPIFRPKLEAPKGPHEWMTNATFVATLDLEPPAEKDGPVTAVRIRFYHVR